MRDAAGAGACIGAVKPQAEPTALEAADRMMRVSKRPFDSPERAANGVKGPENPRHWRGAISREEAGEAREPAILLSAGRR
jgi:hypothetical protein